VIGVAPPDFEGAEPSAPPALYVPVVGYWRLDPTMSAPRGTWFHIMARLRDDVPLATAQAVLHERWAELDEPNRLGVARNARDVVLLEDGSRGYSAARLEFSKAVVVVMGLVAAVFLIACANLATLLFVRGAGRVREMSIRTAIGATRPQLVRQWMTECMMIATLGGAVGLGAASWITELLLRFLTEADRPLLRFQAGPTVVLLSIGLTVAAGLLSGLVPGLRATGAKPEPMLRGHSSAITERRGTLSQLVLSAQLAASLVLTVGGALFVRTLWNLNSTSGGFARQEVVYAVPDFVSLPMRAPQKMATMQEVVDRLRLSPRIEAASMGDPPLMFVPGANYVSDVPGYQFAEGEDNSVTTKLIGPGYFDALGVPLLAGRDYAESDRPSEPNPNTLWSVTIIDEVMAQRYFPDGNAVGQRVRLNGRPAEVEIIGIVPELRVRSMRASERSGVNYIPILPQHLDRVGSTAVLVRPAPGTTVAAVEAEMRAAFAAVAAELPVEIDRLETAIQGTLARDRLLARLSAVFALLGILLAIMGLYASMAHSVTARTREIGIRVALGAKANDVVWTVLRQSLVVTGVGIAIGVPAAILGSRWISPLLFEVSPFDPWILGGASVLLASSGLLAGLLPARRATRLDPSRTLMFEAG
jgi:predicted permease